MSEATESSATTLDAIMGDLPAVMDKLTQGIADLYEKHGEQATDLALAVARVGAISELLPGFALLFAGLGLLRFVKFLMARASAAEANYESVFDKARDESTSGERDDARKRYLSTRLSSGDDTPTFMGFINAFSFLLAILALIVGFLMVMDAWAWVGVFVPEVWLVKAILGL